VFSGKDREAIVMKRFGYLATLTILASGMMLAQTTAPSSDTSNSSNPAAQAQNQQDNGTAQPKTGANTGSSTTAPNPAMPSTTINDQQSSTTSTTGVTEQNPEQPSSTIGTTGSTPPSPPQSNPENPSPSVPQTSTSPDQQPNASSSPAVNPPQATTSSGTSGQTNGARAGATHTPDPGSRMNPKAVQRKPRNNSDQNPPPKPPEDNEQLP